MKATGIPRTAPIPKMLRRLLPYQSLVTSSKKKYDMPIAIRKMPKRAVVLQMLSDRSDIGGFYNCGRIWLMLKAVRTKTKKADPPPSAKDDNFNWCVEGMVAGVQRPSLPMSGYLLRLERFFPAG